MQRHGMFRTFTSFLTRRSTMASAEVKSKSPSPAAVVKHASTISPAAVIPQNVPIPPRGVDYRGKIVLAPMVRSGELPCRLMALKYGADLVWGKSQRSPSEGMSIRQGRRHHQANGHIIQAQRQSTKPSSVAHVTTANEPRQSTSRASLRM